MFFLRPSFKCQPSTTFCCKPRLLNARGAELCQICQGDPSARFLKFCKMLGPGCKLLQKEGQKKHPGIRARVFFLAFFLQVPWPNFAEFQKTRAGGPLGKFDIARLPGTLEARFAAKCCARLALEETPSKKMASIHAWVFFLAFFLQVCLGPNFAEHFRKRALCPGAELCQICQGDPQRAFSEILQSWDQGQTPAKRRAEKTPWRECQHVFSGLRFPSSANLAQHFAANRAS